MKLKEYFLSRRGGQTNMAKSLGVSRSQMSQMVSGHCPISNERCVVIENLTSGLVSRKDLKPDSWEKIWPELAHKEQTDSEKAA